VRGSVIKRGKTWSVVVDLGRDAETGRRQRKWHSGYRTRREAEQARTEILRRLDTGSYIEPSKVTLGEYLFHEWLPAYRGEVRAGTYAAAELHVRRYIVPGLGDTPLQKLVRTQVRGLYAELGESGATRKDGGLSAKTVHNVHLTLRKALGNAVDDGLIPRNPADRAHRMSTDRTEMRTWDREQLTAFLAHMVGDRLAALWRVAATTGMRRGELLGLRWRDVDLDAARLSVSRQLVKGDGGAVYGQPKTSKGRRTLSLDATTVAMLRAHRAAQLEERLAFGAGYHDEDSIFCLPDGSAIDPDGLTQRFERHVREAGVARIRLHDLRHTYATLALKAGVPTKVLSQRLGHASTGITEDLYMHVTPSMDADAATLVAGLMDGTQ
jgi:integrase